MEINLIRDTFADEFTLGKLFCDSVKIGETCEDKDRRLEDGGEKVYGQSAIPRGIYKVSLSFSHHFQKVLPEIHDVPGFDGVRIHGGNTAADTLGCVLLGSIRTSNGVAQCAGVNSRLIEMIQDAEDRGEYCSLEIK